MTENQGQGPSYQIDIEGTLHPWDHQTITVPQLRELGGLPSNLPVVEVDLRAGTQRDLAEDEIITLRPGMGYSKKISFKRG